MAGDEETPLAGDLDREEESPYLRRQKAVAVRRKRFSIRLRWTLAATVVLPALGTLGYFLASYALTSPRFLLSSAEDVVVEGTHYVSRDEVLTALGWPPAGPTRALGSLFRLSLAERKKQVESIPWVRSATVSRALPHRLAVQVVERVPLAFVNVGGRLKVVDADGVLLEKPEKGVFDFPVLTGFETIEGAAEKKQRLALYQDFEKQVAGEAGQWGWLISEVNLSDSDDLKALMVQGPETIQVHFGDRDFSERLRRFLALLPEVRKSNAKIDSVDLRFHNQIVVNPQGKDSGTRE